MVEGTPPMAFKIDESAQVQRDPDGTVRAINHPLAPYLLDKVPDESRLVESAREMVLSYLKEVQQYLGLSEDELRHLRSTTSSRDPSSPQHGGSLRWNAVRSTRGGQSITVSLQQSYWADLPGKPASIDVWQAGLVVTIHTDRSKKAARILGGSSTVLTRIRPERLDRQTVAPAILRLLFELNERNVTEFVSGTLRMNADRIAIRDFGWTLYRVRAGDRRDLARYDPKEKDSGVDPGFYQLFSDLRRPSSRPGTDLIVVRVGVVVRDQEGVETPYRLFIDPRGPEVVFLQALTSCAKGKVFAIDPASATGGQTLPPSASSALLDTQAISVNLQRLAPPVNGSQALSGEHVGLEPDPILGIQPPRRQSPFEFDALSRTNDFAAVNAYHQCDSIIQLLIEFGFTKDSYFADQDFPIKVSHRAVIGNVGCAQGRCVNAQVVQDASGSHRVERIKFALADTSNQNAPLGAACDLRMVWHEFGHVLLIAATGFPEFDFAHSFGDSLAAIMLDPESKFGARPHWAGARGETFPWITAPARHHDRDVTLGWGWFGDKHNPPTNPRLGDPQLYWAEQILSSSIFRLYRATGGDRELSNQAPDVIGRRRAALYIVYLLAEAAGSLGPYSSTPATIQRFVAALRAADIGADLLSFRGMQWTGGCIHKVIDWAFRQQGFGYPASATPPINAAGPVEEVDVYIDDGRHGGYEYTSTYSATPSSLWIEASGRSGAASVNAILPASGVPCFVRIRVTNRGSKTAKSTTVTAFSAAGSAVDSWPGWTALQLGPRARVKADIRSGKSVVFGPFKWTPGAGRQAVLAFASAPGDPANLDPAAALPCGMGPTPIADIVPHDNNIGYREWQLP
jgi:hypothetical protein